MTIPWPTPLGRAAFAETALANAAALGAEQYLILGAGYDTFAYRQPAWAEKLTVFELDRTAALEEKRGRLDRVGVTVPDNVHPIGADLAGADYDPEELELLLARHGFLAYEHLIPSGITGRFFEGWNRSHPERPMEASLASITVWRCGNKESAPEGAFFQSLTRIPSGPAPCRGWYRRRWTAGCCASTGAAPR